jgi:hypothetical protein
MKSNKNKFYSYNKNIDDDYLNEVNEWYKEGIITKDSALYLREQRLNELFL